MSGVACGVGHGADHGGSGSCAEWRGGGCVLNTSKHVAIVGAHCYATVTTAPPRTVGSGEVGPHAEIILKCVDKCSIGGLYSCKMTA